MSGELFDATISISSATCIVHGQSETSACTSTSPFVSSLSLPYYPFFTSMSTARILDSSPVVIPSVRPLKRSASTASLPTPPRTHHKRKSRSKGRQDSDTESNDSQESDGEQETDRVVLGRKKRRTSVTLKGQDEEEEDENAFWTGRSKKAASTDASPAEDSDVSPTALLEYRMKAPVSPPPSTRRRQRHTEPPITPESAGSSSRVLTRAGRRQALRDSPENPFLDDSPPSAAGSPTPRTPTQHEEKPLVTYVL